MKYKIYKYETSDSRGNVINPGHHYEIFLKSKGSDDYGSYSKYRGSDNAIIMNVRKMGSDIIGLVGKHSTEREVTIYSQRDDTANSRYVSDDDYPHAAFIAMPRLGAIAIVDGSRIRADSAIGRIHAVIAYRQNLIFTAEVVKEAYDLGRAVKRFRVFEVDFNIGPVNPHSGDLGLELDEDRKKDHIRSILGKAKSAKNDKISLDGGFLTAVHQLQKSGHATIGFKAENDDGTLIHVPKPDSKFQRSYDAADEGDAGPDVDVRIDFPHLKAEFPLPQGHVTDVRKITRQLTKKENGS